MTTRRHTPRPWSSCCHGRVEFQHCTECHKPAPWRTRLTDEELAAVERRLARPVVVLTRAQLDAAKRTLWEDAYDDT